MEIVDRKALVPKLGKGVGSGDSRLNYGFD
jgi:hypothetical protein